MKILLIGMSGAGKSTFSRDLVAQTDLPILHLDQVWHRTDYSEEAVTWFRQEQENFIASHKNWIIDGNYRGSFDVRFPEADLIIWLKIGRIKAIFRVLKRSFAYHFQKKSRPDMASNFTEKFDREYWEFLKFVWNFPKNQFPDIEKALVDFDKKDHLFIVKTQTDRQKLLNFLQERQENENSN